MSAKRGSKKKQGRKFKEFTTKREEHMSQEMRMKGKKWSIKQTMIRLRMFRK